MRRIVLLLAVCLLGLLLVGCDTAIADEDLADAPPADGAGQAALEPLAADNPGSGDPGSGSPGSDDPAGTLSDPTETPAPTVGTNADTNANANANADAGGGEPAVGAVADLPAPSPNASDTAPDPAPTPNAAPAPATPAPDAAPAASPKPAASPEPGNDTPRQPRPNDYHFVYRGSYVALNQDASLLMAEIGNPNSIFESPSCAFEGIDKILYYNGFLVNTYPNKDKDFVLSISLTNSSVSTPEGASLGMTLEELIGIYGENYENMLDLYSYVKGDVKILFFIENDVIAEITYIYLPLA